jgi:hypothetical protein
MSTSRKLYCLYGMHIHLPSGWSVDTNDLGYNVLASVITSKGVLSNLTNNHAISLSIQHENTNNISEQKFVPI